VYQKGNYLQVLHDENIKNIMQYILFALDTKLI